ncbi:membrane protein insertion efficiency factor YidD [Patescibacteria group bacterium]|nr:membrane protein insertion efficiency factor YidD [Patescibacteria group bacterium]
MLKKAILKLILIYQKTLSPDTGWLAIKHPHGFCRYYPTCSSYSYQAIKRHGLVKGFLKSLIRILKCNPFSKGGYDPLK